MRRPYGRAFPLRDTSVPGSAMASAAAPPPSLQGWVPDPVLLGARIQGVVQPDADTVVLETHRAGAGAAWWGIVVHPERGRMTRLARPPRGRGGPPPLFCQWLRTRLLGGRVTGATLRGPRVLMLVVERPVPGAAPEQTRLVLELDRREGNLLLLDGQQRLLIALRHPGAGGRLRAGAPYEPPTPHPLPADIPWQERYPGAGQDADAVQRAWAARDTAGVLAERQRAARQLLRRQRKRIARRAAKLAEDRQRAQDAARWQRWGELLQIHRAQVRPGLEAVEVPDLFEPDAPPVRIPLDPQAEPGANIERCFQRYRKLRDALPHVAEREAATQREQAQVEALLAAVDAAPSPRALAALADGLSPRALPEQAALVRLLRGSPPPAGPVAEEASGVLRRLSSDGYTILVGRSREDNDRVTFRIAKGRDWWLHAQGVAGSHVVVANPGDGPLPPRTLHEAAWLAAYYSQGRRAGRVEVDYAQRKHVRKQKGGAPGQVLFTRNRSVLVDIADPALRQVLERLPEPAP